MTQALRALVGGAMSAARAPGVLLLLVVASLVAVMPFALVLGERMQSVLAHQPPIDLRDQEIDPEWWMEYRAQARGLEATFTPAIIGFAAPLDNLSAVLDASPRPWILVVPVLLYVAVWAFAWGGVIDRFDVQRGSFTRFLAAGRRHFLRMLVVTLAAALMVGILYATVHALLFGPVFNAMAASLSSERDTFLARVGLYLVFGTCLAVVSLLADYTRIHLVVAQPQSVAAAFAVSRQLMRSRLAAVIWLCIFNVLLFAAVLAAYGLIDRRLGGWRAVIVGQGYIVARLALRMVTTGSQLRLSQFLRS